MSRTLAELICGFLNVFSEPFYYKFRYLDFMGKWEVWLQDTKDPRKKMKKIF